MKANTATNTGDIGAIESLNLVVKILHPKTGAPTGLEIELRSMTSPEVRSVQRTITDRLLTLQKRGKTFKAEEVEANTYDQLSAATVGWTWNDPANWHGDKPTFTRELARKLYAEFPWITAQVDDALGDDKVFFKG